MKTSETPGPLLASPRLWHQFESAKLSVLVRLGWRTGNRSGRSFGTAPDHDLKHMILLYVMAAMALGVVGYLAHDFYDEQLRARLIPARSDRKNKAQNRRRV